MAKREISIVLKAKNELQIGLAKAKSALQDFGSSVLSIGKWAGTAFAAAAAAVAGFVAKAVSEYAKAEMENRKLEASFRAFGEDVSSNVESINKLADAIERETGVTSGNIKERAARLKMLGVETSALQDAVKATVALAAYNVQEEEAIRAVAQAHEGNYKAIQKLIPSLKEITDESLLAIEVNNLLNRGYSAQREQLDTVSGRWGQFKEAINQVWEEFGTLIAQNETVQRVLEFATEKVRQFVQQLSQWAKTEEFQEIQSSIEGIINAIAKGGPDRQKAIVAIGEYLSAALSRGAEIAGETLKELAPKIGALIGGAAKAALGTVAQENRLKEAASQLGIKTPAVFAPFGMGFFGVTKEQEEAIKKQAALNYQTEIYKGLGIEITKNTEGQTIAQERLARATEALITLGLQSGKILTKNATENESYANREINLINARTEAYRKSLENKKSSEKKNKEESLQINIDAAAEYKQVWDAALEHFNEQENKKQAKFRETADVAVREATRASMANTDIFGDPIRGGYFESSGDRALAIQNLMARGALPTSGSSVMVGSGERYQRLILEEITRIRVQNQNLLTLS